LLTVTTSRAHCNNLIEAADADEDIRKDERMFPFTPKDFRQDLDDARLGGAMLNSWVGVVQKSQRKGEML
jgi:hypothetical protein